MGKRHDASEGEPPKHNPFAGLKAKLGPLPEGEAPGTPEAVAAEPAGDTPREGAVRLRRERAGRGGKTVVVIEGPGLAGRDLDELARAAGRALGTRARAEGGTVVVQGDVGDRLATWLEQRDFAPVRRAN